MSPADADVVAGKLSIKDEKQAEQVRQNCKQLLKLFSQSSAAKLVKRHPLLLMSDLPEWSQFLVGFGLDADAFFKVLKYSPAVFEDASALFAAGNAIAFLRAWSFSNQDISERVVPCYPQILRLKPEDLDYVVTFLRGLDYTEEDIRHTLVTSPQLLCPEAHTGLFPILQRIRSSRVNKYVQGGSYHL